MMIRSGTARRRAAAAGALAALVLAGCDLGAPPTVYPQAGGQVSDVNGDGHVDLTAVYDDRVEVLAGDGAGGLTFSSTPGSYGFPNLYRRDLADADGDGRDDLFVAWHANPPDPCPGPPPECPEPPPPPPIQVQVLLNDGAGGFGPPSTVATFSNDPNTTLGSWEVADVNGDGHPDFVMHRVLAEVSVHLGDGTGAFGSPVVSAPSTYGFPVGQIEMTDADGDGRLDLLVSGPLELTSGAEGFITVMWGDGAGAFPDSASFDSTDLPVTGDYTAITGIGVGDVNGDGVTDLVGQNYSLSGTYQNQLKTFSVMLGTGGRSFATAVERPSATGVGSFDVADFDGDGYDDVAISVQRIDGSVQHHDAWIRFGDATGSLAEARFIPNGGGGPVADLDEDGKPDLVGRGPTPGSPTTWVFLNRWEERPG